MTDTDGYHCEECGWEGDASKLAKSGDEPTCPLCGGSVEDVE